MPDIKSFCGVAVLLHLVQALGVALPSVQHHREAQRVDTDVQDGSGRTIRHASSYQDSLDTFVHEVVKHVTSQPACGAPSSPIAPKHLPGTCRTVVLSVSNNVYRGRFEELIQSVTSRAKLPLAMVALDDETTKFFRSAGVPTLLMDVKNMGVPEHRQPGAGRPEAVMRAKFEITSRLLNAGIRVVMSEMDIFWKHNPLKLESDLKGDFLVSEHHRKPELNIGFYIAKPAPAVQHVFSKLHGWINRADRYDNFTNCKNLDQKLLDFAVRGAASELAVSCGFPREHWAELYDTKSSELQWSYIPWARLPHWHFNHTADPQIVAAHIWSDSGPPGFQMEWAYENGFWQSSKPPPTWYHIQRSFRRRVDRTAVSNLNVKVKL